MARELLSQKELADRLGCVPRTIRRLVDSGILSNELPEDGGHPVYPWPENREKWMAYQEALIRGRIMEELGHPEDPATRKLEAEARRAEIQLAELERSLIPLELLEETVAELLDRLQAAILNIPGQWSAHLVKVKSRRAATVKLRPLMAELLEQLQDISEEFES